MSQPTIIAYMKPVCGWSNGVRAIFAKYGLEYDDRDIINNADNYREMVQKTRQPYQPCVQINDVMLADVSGDEVEAYLVDAGIVSPARQRQMFPPTRPARTTAPPLPLSASVLQDASAMPGKARFPEVSV